MTYLILVVGESKPIPTHPILTKCRDWAGELKILAVISMEQSNNRLRYPTIFPVLV
jgi:hypothetical protein